MKNKMKGKVTKVQKGPTGKNNFYIIETDNEKYVAHVGDLASNEDIVYRSTNRADLEVGDEVEFELFENQFDGRAIKVKKLNSL